MGDASVNPQTKRALLVGIDTYPRLPPAYKLHGAARDAELMRDLLCGTFGFSATEVVLLCNDAAERDKILAALNDLAARTQPNDVVVFYFSGHGSQMTDRENDEPDGKDETILPYDTGRGSTVANRDITDDEIYLWIRLVAAKTPNITLIFDCCNSGSMSRAVFEGTNRSAPIDDRPIDDLPPSPIPREKWTELARASQQKATVGWLPVGDRYVMIAACRDEQKAGEYPPSATEGPDVHGCLTYFLHQELSIAGPGTTYRDVFEPTRRRVTAVYPDQVPQFEGNRDRALFGAVDLEPMRYLPVTSRTGTQAMLGGGLAHAVRTGSRWGVYAAGTKKPEPPAQPLGELEVTEVRGLSSEARIISETAPSAIAPGARAFPRTQGFEVEPLVVRIEAPEGDTAAANLAKCLAQSPLLRVAAAAEPTGFQVVLLGPRGKPGPTARVPQVDEPLSEATWAIVASGDRLVAPLKPAADAAAVCTNLGTIATYLQSLALRNPSSALANAIEVTLYRSSDGSPWEEARPQADGRIPYMVGDRLAFRVINKSSTPLHLNVMDFGISYKVSMVYPPASGADETLPRLLPFDYGRNPRETLKFDALPDWHRGPEGYETLKFIVSNVEIDFSWMRQEGVRGAVSRAPEDWWTREVDLVVRRK
jgi:hypothetical protein